MSLLMFVHEFEQVLILTDTLATTMDGNPYLSSPPIIRNPTAALHLGSLNILQY
jgi:hypothetical protein